MHVCQINTCTVRNFAPIIIVDSAHPSLLTVEMEGRINTFIALTKRLAFAALFSYFVWKVVASVGSYNRKEITIHIHIIINVT